MESQYSVEAGQNMMVVRAANHSWIALVREGTEVLRESNGEPSTAFLVQPGEYQVRTDGELVSVDLEHRDLGPTPS